jgi:hypothetical protein
MSLRKGSIVADDFILLKRGSDTDFLITTPGALVYANDFSGDPDEHFGTAADFGGKNHREAQLGTSARIIADG